MNMKSNVKRYLAALLTVIMIFQQSGANAIFASSENIPAATTTEEVAVQSEEPAESEPVPQAEEEQQPEQTPEAEPEQTPETTPEETPAPEVTPETTPEVTETPEETPAPEEPKDENQEKDPEDSANEIAELEGEGANLIVPSTNLNDFVTSANFVNAKTDANGKLILVPGKTYEIDLSFAEIEQVKQMATDQTLIYSYPADLTPSAQNGEFTVHAIVGSNDYEVKGTYEIVNGQIRMTLDPNDPNFKAVNDASNVTLSVKLKASLNNSEGEKKIDFSNNVVKTITFDTSASVSIEKNGQYDRANGKFRYTVTVRSTGQSKNVAVNDNITGTILKYAQDLTVTSNTGRQVDGTLSNVSDNGFTYTIPSMSDGETITFNYSADIDYSKLADGQTEFTADQTANSVSAKGDNNDTPATADKDFGHNTQISIPMSKSGTVGNVDNETKKQTTNWSITINSDAREYVGGSTVTDTLIQVANAPTIYSGDGIKVEIYDKNGQLVKTLTPNWSELQAFDEDSLWKYELPNDANKTPYKYVISYTTETDISKIKNSGTTLNNTATDGNGGTANGSVDVKPGSDFGVKKQHANASKTEVDWTVTVTIPEDGFNNSFNVTDNLPSTWTNGWHADSYKAGSMTVTYTENGTSRTLQQDTDYTLNTQNQQLILEFNNVGKLFPEVSKGTKRTLTLSYKTIPDSEWPSSENHNNTVTVIADGNSKSDSDTYKLADHKIEKKFDAQDTKDGLPIFKFCIYLEGVDSDSIEIADVFDTDIFKVYEGDDEYAKPRVGGGDQSWDAANNGNQASKANGGSVESPVTKESFGATFKLHINEKSKGIYHNWYCLRYALQVKDQNALRKLKQMAAGATNHKAVLSNKASWDDASTNDVTWEYTLPNPVTKSITNVTNSNGYKAYFEININKEKLKLNGGNAIDLNDVLAVVSGQGAKIQLLPETVKFEIDPNSDDYSWDYSEDLMTLTAKIPDESYVKITYQAKILGKGEVKYNNTVNISGSYSASTGNQSVTISSSAEGTSEIFEYTIVKKDAETKAALAGAIFSLSEKQKDGSWKELPVKFTTGSDGTVKITPGNETVTGWHLYKNHVYKLEEITAPQGYEKADPIIFTAVSRAGNDVAGPDGKYNGESIYVYDYKGVSVDLEATKKLQGKNLTTGEFEFTLTPDSNNSNEKNTVQNKRNDQDGKIKFDSLKFAKEGTYVYTIAEKNTGKTGVTYDATQYKVTIEVTDNGGILTATIASVKKIVGSTETNGNSNEIVFENSYETGSLTVTKKVQYNGAPDKVTGKFYVRLFSDAEGTKGASSVQTINLDNASEGTTTFSNLEVEKTYYVYETDETGTKVGNGYAYQVSYENQTVKITREQLNASATVINNKSEKGSLTVTKKVTYNGVADKVTGNFYVRLFSDADGKTAASDVQTISLNGESQGTAVFDNLEIRNTYYLYETDENGAAVKDAIGGYTVSGDNGAAITISRDNKNRTAEITNGKTEKGSLTVTKKVQYNGAPDKVTGKFYVRLFSDAEGTKGASSVQTINLDNASEGTTTFSNLEVEKTYYVYETDETGTKVGNGYAYQVSYENQTVKITREQLNASATVINNKSEKGSLTVTKKVEYNGKADEVTGIFYVGLFKDAKGTQPEGEIKAISLNNTSQGTAVFDNLEIGNTYYLYETDENGNAVKEAIGGYTVSGDNGAKISISRDDKNQTAEIINGKTEKGSLTVTKKVQYNGALDEVTGTFYVRLFNDAEGIKEASSVQTIDLANASQGETTFNNLEVGKTYYVYETDETGTKVGNGYAYQVSYENQTVKITRGNLNATATVINSKSEKGSLTVTKKVTYNGAADKVTGNFYVRLFSDSDGKTAASDVQTISLNGESQGTVAFDNLEIGNTYYLYETDEKGTAVNGVIGGYTVSGDNGKKFEITRKDKNQIAEITNGKSESGNLTVTKKVEYNGKADKVTEDFYVRLFSDEAGTIAVSDVQTISLKDASEGTATFSGLEVGKTYYVYETDKAGAKLGNGYAYQVSYEGQKVEITRGNLNASATVINNKSEKGSLTVTKKVEKNGTANQVTGNFYVRLFKDAEGIQPEGDMKTISLNNESQGTAVFDNLEIGTTYYLYETDETGTVVRDVIGEYTINGDSGKKIEISRKDKNQVAEIVNSTVTKEVTVKISKVDAETYEVLGRAHLQVIDPDGNVVAEWDSTKNAHKITGLKPGVTYTLRETKAPKGYDVAADTTFELNEDGTINTANTTTSISGDDLLVKDEKTVDKTVSVSVTKRLVTVDGQVIGAPDATYYVALYSDPDCTQRVSDVMALNYKNASVSTVTFTGLKKGQTYYVGECEADGTSYLANVNADGTLYTVDFSDGNTVEVTNNDGSKTIYFDNQFEKVPDGYYKEGELNITKKLVGGDGKAKNSSEIFYAGIFSDADFTQLSPDVSDNIVPLDLAGGSEVTSQVKVSIPESGSITLYVTEVDSKGNPVAGAASFKYDVSVDNMQVTFDDDNISADVVITNSENTPKVTPTPTTTTPNTPVTQSGSTTKSAVKTGDSTPIGMFVGLFAAAAVIAGAAVFFKRRKK